MPEQETPKCLAILIRHGNVRGQAIYVCTYYPPHTEDEQLCISGAGSSLSEALTDLAENVEGYEDEGYSLAEDIAEDPLVYLGG